MILVIITGRSRFLREITGRREFAAEIVPAAISDLGGPGHRPVAPTKPDNHGRGSAGRARAHLCHRDSATPHPVNDRLAHAHLLAAWA